MNTQEEDDVELIQLIYEKIEGRGLDELTEGCIDTLLEISDGPGHSASMARNILMLLGYRFETQYVLPSVPGPGFKESPILVDPKQETLTLYPNPNPGKSINVFMTANMSEERNLLSIWSPTGVLVLERTLKPGINTIDVEQELHGIYIYKISNRNQTLGIGRVVFLK